MQVEKFVILSQKEARRRFTPQGVEAARASSVDGGQDPWRVPLEVYELCQRTRRRDSTARGPSFAVPEGFDRADYRLDSKGSSGCGCKS